MKKLALALFLAGTLIGSLLTPSLAQKPARVPAAARQELLKAARAHRVNINTDKITYESNQHLTIVRAPIQGSDKYKDADFEKGAPIVLAIIKSSEKYVVPDGSYVVTIQLPPKAAFGEAIYTDPAGKVIARQGLDKPLFPLSDRRDPCSIESHPRLVRTSPGPIPGPDGGYGIDLPCYACACQHYRILMTPRKVEGAGQIVMGDMDARGHANSDGDMCMASSNNICPDLPVPH